jgi:hypothetical protein
VSGVQSIYLLAEGQTEYEVVDTVIQPHLEAVGFHVRKTVLVTRPAVAGGPARRGGVSRWSRLESEIRRILRDPTIDLMTTMIDYYGLPADVPGMANRLDTEPLERVSVVEAAIAATIGDERFVPHLVLHEFETWVLAAAVQLGHLADDRRLAAQLRGIVAEHGGPENVNDGASTAPSKRIRALYPAFNKTFEGPLAVADLGLGELRKVCPHADAWLHRLESLA